MENTTVCTNINRTNVYNLVQSVGRKMAMDISKAGLWAMRLAWKSFARYSGVAGGGVGEEVKEKTVYRRDRLSGLGTV
jgi:hypothetical protein